MRTLRLSLVGTVILTLLGGMPALAQDPEKATWTHVTGRAQEEERTGDMFDNPRHFPWDGSVEPIPGGTASYTVEWSEPRLPTTMRIEQNSVLHHGDMQSRDDWMLVYAIAVVLDDADGAFVGSSRGVFGSETDRGQVVLTGEDAYEGLSALLDITWTWTGDHFGVVQLDGFVFEGEVPPMPDPVEVRLP